MNATELPSIDELPESAQAPRRGSTRWLALATIVLTVCLIGAAALSDAAANLGDVAKIFSVVLFVAAMVSLALGMVADAYRS